MALDITFVGIKPNGKCFDFSVVNNAKVDVINFELTTPLDSVYTLEQLSEFNAYVKVQSAGGDYIDKISATSTYDSENGKLTVSFTLHKKTTAYKNIALQLQFEDLQNEVISQTEIVALSLKGTINADKEISDKYPEAIQELEKEVGSYSGRIEEVEEKVENAVLKTDIVDNLNSEDDTKVLSAKQGKVLNDKISNAISGVYKAQGTTTVATLNALIITEEMNGFVYDMLDSGTLAKGSVQVMEGDNVAIIWNEDKTDWKWDKLSGLVDLSNYPTLDGNNTLTGQNTFRNYITFQHSSSARSYKFVGTDTNQLRLYRDDQVQLTFDSNFAFPKDNTYEWGARLGKFKCVHTYKLNTNASGFGLTIPDTSPWTADKEIATTDQVKVKANESVISDQYDNTKTYAVGDIVIYNNVLYRCNTTISVAEDFDSSKWTAINVADVLKSGTFNVINAIDIVNNTLTQEQLDLIKNRKPTIINGVVAGYVDVILYYGFTTNNVARGYALAKVQNANRAGIIKFSINASKVISFATSFALEVNASGYTTSNMEFLNLYALNNKVLPSYPASPSIEQVLTYGTDNNLKYTDTPNANIDEAYDSTRTYNSGDTCIYENHFYKCNSDNTTGTWDSSKWDRTTVADKMPFKTLTTAEWSNLTANERIANVKKGVIIKGNITSGQITIKNPIFLPPTTSTSVGLWGICLYGGQYEVNNFRPYSISLNYGQIGLNNTWKYLNLIGLQIYGKVFPTNPTDTTKQYKFVQKVGGNLDYVEDSADIVKLDTGTYTSGTTMSANDLAFFQPLLDMNIEEALKYLSNKLFMRIDSSRNETQTSTYFSVRASGQAFDRNWYDLIIYFGDWGKITLNKGNLQNGTY